MLPEIHDNLNQLLSSQTNGLKYLSGLVIGCHSYGDNPSSYEYSLLNNYTNYLCCLDIDTIDNKYLCQIQEDVTKHYFKEDEYNVIYMFDVIEHVSQEKGERILKSLYDRYSHIYLTTPERFIELYGHQSVYSEGFLRNIGYKTYKIPFYEFLPTWLMGSEIIAYK